MRAIAARHKPPLCQVTFGGDEVLDLLDELIATRRERDEARQAAAWGVDAVERRLRDIAAGACGYYPTPSAKYPSDLFARGSSAGGFQQEQWNCFRRAVKSIFGLKMHGVESMTFHDLATAIFEKEKAGAALLHQPAICGRLTGELPVRPSDGP